MNIIAHTSEHFAEFESGFLSIVRANGDAVCIKFPGIAAEFRSCVKSHGPERAIATFLRMTGRELAWVPMYKPDAAARLLTELDA